MLKGKKTFSMILADTFSLLMSSTRTCWNSAFEGSCDSFSKHIQYVSYHVAWATFTQFDPRYTLQRILSFKFSNLTHSALWYTVKYMINPGAMWQVRVQRTCYDRR